MDVWLLLSVTSVITLHRQEITNSACSKWLYSIQRWTKWVYCAQTLFKVALLLSGLLTGRSVWFFQLWLYKQSLSFHYCLIWNYCYFFFHCPRNQLQFKGHLWRPAFAFTTHSNCTGFQVSTSKLTYTTDGFVEDTLHFRYSYKKKQVMAHVQTHVCANEAFFKRIDAFADFVQYTVGDLKLHSCNMFICLG